MNCRPGCGACCIAPSISSPIPGMPGGKPAGTRCVQLSPANRCEIFGHSDRPAVCVRLRPTHDMCGDDTGHALAHLEQLEQMTRPVGAPHGTGPFERRRHAHTACENELAAPSLV